MYKRYGSASYLKVARLLDSINFYVKMTLWVTWSLVSVISFKNYVMYIMSHLELLRQ